MTTFINYLKKLTIKLNRKQKKFTWAQLASHLKISKSYLSQILKGAKNFPVDQLDDLIDYLDLDHLSKHDLIQCYINDELSKLKKSSKYVSKYMTMENSITQRTKPNSISAINSQALELFDRWYYTAILDLISTKHFQFNFDWIAKKLNLNKIIVEIAWNFLHTKGYIEKQKDNVWVKTNKKFRYIAGDNKINEKELTRTCYNYYSQYMEIAKAQILSGTSTKKDRLIQGVTCSANLAKFEKVKLQLENNLYQAAENLSEGDCTEIYYLLTLAIPLTKK